MANNRADHTALLSTPSGADQAPALMKKRLIRTGIWVFLLMLALAIFIINWGVNNKRQELESALNKRLEIIAQGRADVISLWLSGLTEQARRITQADLFRLYAAEVSLLKDDITLLSSPGMAGESSHLSQQLPLMENILRDFQQNSPFEVARIIAPSGDSYLATDSKTNLLQPDQRKLAEQAANRNQTLFSPAEAQRKGLFVHIFVPINPPQTADKAVATLMLTVNVSTKITEILSPSPLSVKGERTRLLQLEQKGYRELAPWLSGNTTLIADNFSLSQQLHFARRISPGSQNQVYSLAVKIPALDWWILQEANAKTSMAPLVRYRQVAISMVALLSLTFFILTGALWWRLVGTENQKIANQFRQLADQIDKQRQLLDGINGNLQELIGLKDNSGYYIYANQAFADAVGRQSEELYGLDDAAIFGFDTAKRLATADRKVVEERTQVTTNEDIYLQSELHHFQIAKVPFIDSNGQITGIIASFRDVTEMVEQQKKTATATRQTIEALAKTVEFHDPYLAGHSRLVSVLSVAIAKNLGLSEALIKTVEIASYLSQIGKVYVPAELLQKPGRLSPEEKREIEKHVDHSANILKDISFDLPVLESLYQMHEHLDGSGYPAGLKDEVISQPARILAVANSFAAMLKPRSYRPARSSADIFTVFEQEHNKYDMAIVRALQEVMKSPVGSRIREGHY